MKRTRRVKPTQKVNDTKVDNKQYSRKELETILKPKMKAFVREYCLNAWNGTQAYKKAYGRHKELSNKVCQVNASRLLLKAIIQQYKAYLLSDIEALTGVSKTKNLHELAKIAYSSIAHLHMNWIELKDYEDLTPDQLAAIKDTETKTITTEKGAEVTTVKIVLHPKQSAIETINKMMGYNATEQIKVDQKTTHAIDMTNYTDEEKAILLKMARKNEYT